MKKLPVCHSFDSSRLESIKKHGLKPDKTNVPSHLVLIDEIADFMAEQLSSDMRRSGKVHAFSPYWKDTIIAFCRTDEMDACDDPVVCFDVDENTPVFPGEIIANCEIKAPGCLDQLKEAILDNTKLKDVYFSTEQMFWEALTPSQPPDKLRFYQSIAEALQKEK